MVALSASANRDNSSTVTRIVGIGASAGGLEALEQFFAQVPPTSGLAYIVVQHLDPTHKAMLVALLQRVTSIPVMEAEDAVRVAPNCVYVIAPNTELSVSDGVLRLAMPAEPRGLRLPVNLLFSSLARDQREAAIAVVLSGMGSDGTLGLQAIKALGGLSAVQQPETASFDAMPKSAIAAGCADIVAPAAELPARILATIGNTPEPLSSGAGDGADAGASSEGPIEHIFGLLRQRTRHDFSLYKINTVHRRIARRMAIHSLATPAQYVEFLHRNPLEIDLLFKELLIGVTAFFRDPMVWAQLAETVLPELLERGITNKHVRAWVIGCSTGEEAYSLAMIFCETIQRLPKFADHTLQIFASDLSSDAVATARSGEYSAAIKNEVSPERLARFFTLQEDRYRISTQIRDMVLFAEHDIILDPPFTRLDIVCCRNLMIYFDASLQHKLLPLFHYSLHPGGALVLGNSETIGRFKNLFAPIDAKLRLYRRQDGAAVGGAEFLVKSFPPLSSIKKESPLPSPPPATPHDGLQTAAEHVMLQRYALPAVIINRAGDIVYISGRTGRYLEPAAGKANWNFHAMIRERLRSPLADALIRAANQSEPVELHGLQVDSAVGSLRVDVTVQRLQEPSALQDMLIVVFRDAPAVPRRRGKAVDASDSVPSPESQQYLAEIRSLREEAQSTKEQLQSTNEELQSTNEELQSTNEELTTSKEEMQSMNEELQTINAELQTRLDDLALAQSDMKNLLNSTDIAILFLDQELNVRRYTEQAARIISLRESDIGRPLSDLATSLEYPELHDDAQRTMETLVFSEKQIRSNDERWFSARIMPYRRLDNVIDGAVITFVDITATKELEAKLRDE